MNAAYLLIRAKLPKWHRARNQKLRRLGMPYLKEKPMCDFGASSYPSHSNHEQLRAIFVETILPALRSDCRCADLADAVVGIEVIQDTVILKLKHSVRVNNEMVGRQVRGLNLSFSIITDY